MAFQFEYNETTAKEAGSPDFKPVPNGIYNLSIVKAEEYMTKEKEGKPSHRAGKLEFIIEDGDHQKQHLFVNYIGIEKNPANLHALYKMAKMTSLNEMADFIGHSIRAAVLVKKDKGSTDPSTGKVYPPKLINEVVFSLEEPEKLVKGAPVLTEDKADSEKPVDKSDSWT